MPLRGVLVCASLLLCTRTVAQSVISTHSGLVHFSEGAISIEDRALSPINGRFPEIPEGSQLRTNDGRAEILLAPEIFLWLDRNSAICMQRNSLTDTRIELLAGSAIVQSTEPPSENGVTLIFTGAKLGISAHSLYRIDVTLSQLTVLSGHANVTTGGESVVVNEANRLAVPSRIITSIPKAEPDSLDQWAQERRKVITSDNLNRVRMENRSNASKNATHRRGRAFPAVGISIPRRT
jgi:hypothetical protein